ncbi:hypothetical protein Dxin01_03877 [Deinococcus xinjiangensis]|uniref:Uncharacterized protein n=2 Tax=Deinococcus xinjiangensis TaxID=457454 RepID=A0ABP9VFV5_9DEIO
MTVRSESTVAKQRGCNGLTGIHIRPELRSRRCYPNRMALWLVVVAILLSATLILALSLGPLKTAANVGTIRLFAFIQYLAAALLALARLLGKA